MGNDLQIIEGQQLKVMVEVANAFPRELETFTDDVCKEVMKDIERSKDFAVSCIYCVPVGTDKEGNQKFVSGPSVRITEIMQKYWKHLRVIVNGTIDNDEIVVNGLIVDCQANNAETLIDRVSCGKWSERRKSLKLKAMQSIMKRDLRLSIMGKGYADELKGKIFDGLFKNISEGWKACLSAFSTFKVSENELFNYFKINKGEDVDREILFNALGIYNYLKETAEDPSSIFASHNSNKPNIRPEDIKVGKKKNAKKAPKKYDSTPVVMDQEEFTSLVEGLALQARISVVDGLREGFSVDTLEDVLPELQSKVIDFFTSKSQTAGA